MQTAPEFGALAATVAPLVFKEWKMLVERALTCSEEVGPLAPDNLTHQFPTISDVANNLFNRRPKPAKLPVEQPTRFELAIDLKKREGYWP